MVHSILSGRFSMAQWYSGMKAVLSAVYSALRRAGSLQPESRQSASESVAVSCDRDSLESSPRTTSAGNAIGALPNKSIDHSFASRRA